MNNNDMTYTPFINPNIRAKFRDAPEPNGINQGFSWGPLSVSPYDFRKTLRYVSGLLGSDAFSMNDTNITPTIKANEAVGVRYGLYSHEPFKNITKPVNILFAGDVMISRSGESIQLDSSFKNLIEQTDFFVLNIEAGVNFEKNKAARTSLSFEMSQKYLKDLVDQIEKFNPKIQIVYDIANNHACDGKFNPIDTTTDEEKELYELDDTNFSILRTIASIKQINKEAIIIGAELLDEKYGENKTPGFAILEKHNARIGIIGYTDVMNHNQSHNLKSIIRYEDIYNLNLNEMKKTYGLDEVIVVGHGNLEQCIYPTQRGREIAERLVKNGAGIFVGHGPHVPHTNELTDVGNKTKLAVHSLGDFCSSKNHGNTGLNALLAVAFGETTNSFNMLPIEANVSSGVPIVKLVQSSSQYPKLEERFNNLFPHKCDFRNSLKPVSNASLYRQVQSASLKLKQEQFHEGIGVVMALGGAALSLIGLALSGSVVGAPIGMAMIGVGAITSLIGVCLTFYSSISAEKCRENLKRKKSNYENSLTMFSGTTSEARIFEIKDIKDDWNDTHITIVNRNGNST